jgi:hypothetical protein
LSVENRDIWVVVVINFIGMLFVYLLGAVELLIVIAVLAVGEAFYIPIKDFHG